MGHQRVIGVDRGQSGQTDGGALHAAGEADELVRLDGADHDLEVRLDVVAVGPDRGLTRGGSEEDEIVASFGIVRHDPKAAQDLRREDGWMFVRAHRRVAADCDVERDGTVRYPQTGQPVDQGWEEVLVGNRTGLVVDGDRDRSNFMSRPGEVAERCCQGA